MNYQDKLFLVEFTSSFQGFRHFEPVGPNSTSIFHHLNNNLWIDNINCYIQLQGTYRFKNDENGGKYSQDSEMAVPQHKISKQSITESLMKMDSLKMEKNATECKSLHLQKS